MKNKLREYRKARKMTREQLSKKGKCEPETIIAVENVRPFSAFCAQDLQKIRLSC